MRVSPSLLLSLGVLLAGSVLACSDAPQSSPPTASTAELTVAERSKIDTDLLHLMSDSMQLTNVPSTRRPDGSRAYAVRIRTSDVGALQTAGVSSDSTANGTVWTYLSLAEIRGLAQLDAVAAVRADNDPLPRTEPRHR